MSNQNNTPEQKAQWKENQKLNRASSRFIKVTPSNEYKPVFKSPSKRDLHRMDTGYNKYRR
jgi:hypothetical protein